MFINYNPHELVQHRHYMRERDEELLQKEQARHVMLAPLRGQQLKNYVTDIRNQLNSERNAEKKAAYTEAVTKYEHYEYCFLCLYGVFLCHGRTVYEPQEIWRPVALFHTENTCSFHRLAMCNSLPSFFVCFYRAKEQKAKLYEARLKALAGDEEA